MRKPIAFIIAFLLVAPIILAIAVGPASAKDIATILLNESIQISPNLKANLQQVEISDMTIGGSYAPDPMAVIYPILWYTYQNVGSIPEHGHLHVQFIDDQGQVYDATDPGTLEPVQPGKTTASRPLEINIPRDRKVTSLVIIQGFNKQTIPLVYPGTASPTSTPAPSGSASVTPGSLCLGSLILPLTVVGMAWAGMRLSRKQP